jgi:hypothetical protein
MINIAVIGAGQLGSRHLQALANVKKQINIQVVDPSSESLKLAEARFNEVNRNFTGFISFHSSITDLKKKLEIAIIATGSRVRRVVLEELVSHSTVNFLILEKFLFPIESDYKIAEKILADNNIKTWVNCPRRLIGFYQRLREDLKGSVHFSVTGNSWGLGCNGIHQLDLFAFLTKTKAITLTNNLIDPILHQSKRPGYIEFTGTITGFSDKHTFRITSFDGPTAISLTNIHTSQVRYSIEEGPTAKVWRSSAESNWGWEELSFNMAFQSKETNLVIDDLLENGTCGLTTYKESAELHILFLNNLISFLQKINNDNSIDQCLIT